MISTRLLNKTDTIRRGLLYGTNSLCLALGLLDLLFFLSLCTKNGSFLLSLRIQNGGLLVALSHQDHRLLLALSPENGLPALTLCLHLLLHSFLNSSRRNDILKFHSCHLNAPWIGGNIQRLLHLGIDGLSGGKGLIQFQITDNITKGSGCQILYCQKRTLHTISIHLGICNIKKYHRINLHSYIILGNNRLGRKILYLLF